MAHWSARPRDANGWRIPAEGTISRKVYNLAILGKKPREISAEIGVAFTTVNAMFLDIQRMPPATGEPRIIEKPVVAPVEYYGPFRPIMPPRILALPKPDPTTLDRPHVKGAGRIWWAWTRANGYTAMGETAEDAIRNLLEWRRARVATTALRPSDFVVVGR